MTLIESTSEPIPQQEALAFFGREDDRTVVWLHGEHDISTVAALSEVMAEAIAADDADLVVDLSGVRFMGSATVAVIVRTQEFLHQRSRSLVMRFPPTCARLVLDVFGCSYLGRPADATPIAAARALRSWVAVPAADRADPTEELVGPVGP